MVITILVVLIVILALLLAGVRLIGLQVFSVLSGSMEPAYHTGSLIYVKEVDPYQLESGDVITFMLDEDTVAIQRIVSVVPDEEDTSVIRFQTKGDTSNAADGTLVHYKNVVGSPVLAIPKLGYVANYIQNPPGRYIAISVGVILLILLFLPGSFTDGEKDKKRSKTRKAAKSESTHEAETHQLPNRKAAAADRSKKKKPGKYAGKYAK